MRVDLHVHTTYSRDALTTCAEVARWAKRRQLDAVAITDHNAIAGALAARAIAGLCVIVGEEIRTNQGEIIGLFLEQQIEPGLSPEETIRLIRAQGGLVYVPHPLDRVRGSALGYHTLARILDQVDVIEALNARVTFPMDNRLAQDVARAYRLAVGAGSDAHQGFEIGRAYVDMAPFSDAQSFLANLGQARICGHISSPLVHVASACAKAARELAPSFSLPR